MELDVKNPVVLLMGKTGAGKSTLGNLLTGAPHNNGPFLTASRMDPVTQECKTAPMLIDGVLYDIVDTPGIFDTREGTVPVLNKIAKDINKCAHGVKAIIIVFDAGRFTEEQRNVLNEIRTFLGKDAVNNIITVFTRATKAQTNDRNVMQRDWNQPVRTFIQGIGNRWGISLNPDIFLPDEETFKVRLREIKDLIISIQGIYTTEQLEKNLQEQAEAKRRKEEEEERAKQEYEEKLKEDAKREAEEAHRREVERIRRENQEAEEAHRREVERIQRENQEAEEAHRREIERIQRERENNREVSLLGGLIRFKL